MPNDVHVRITPQIAVSKLTHCLKRFTASILDKQESPSGKSYDRVVRDNTEFNRIADYVEMNPCTQGSQLHRKTTGGRARAQQNHQTSDVGQVG